jgi:hypothetical protein
MTSGHVNPVNYAETATSARDVKPASFGSLR